MANLLKEQKVCSSLSSSKQLDCRAIYTTASRDPFVLIDLSSKTCSKRDNYRLQQYSHIRWSRKADLRNICFHPLLLDKQIRQARIKCYRENRRRMQIITFVNLKKIIPTAQPSRQCPIAFLKLVWSKSPSPM